MRKLVILEVVHSTEFIQPVVPAYVHHGVIEPNYHVAEVIEPVPKPAPIYLRAPSPVPVAPSSYVISNEPLPFSYYNGNRINSYKAEVFPYAGVPHFYAGGPTAPVASVALPYRRKSTQAKIKST